MLGAKWGHVLGDAQRASSHQELMRNWIHVQDTCVHMAMGNYSSNATIPIETETLAFNDELICSSSLKSSLKNT